MNITFVHPNEENSTEYNVSTLITLLYYVVVTYDENFKIVAEAVDNNGDVLDGLRIIFILVSVLLFIYITLAFIITYCVLSGRIKEKFEYTPKSSPPYYQQLGGHNGNAPQQV